MPKTNKKQRHQAKRDAKRRESKRRDSVSPLKRLADAPGPIECWMSKTLELNGQSQIFVYKQAAGLTGVACFLVDQGVVGLKDAWTTMNVDRANLDEMMEVSRDQGIVMTRTTVDEVRRLVAGAARWAHDNGMRLPKDWIKSASLFGGVGDWESADVSQFVLEFGGHPEDLRRRLIGESFDSFVRRTDIDFEFSDEAPYLNHRSGDYENTSDLDDIESFMDEVPSEEIDKMLERLNPVATALAADSAVWFSARNQTPSPLLFEAWESLLLATILAKASMPDAPEDEVSDFSFRLLQNMADGIDDSKSAEHDKAVGQALEYLQSDPSMMQKAVMKHGLSDDPGEQS